jgi:PAS domain-containing protein
MSDPADDQPETKLFALAGLLASTDIVSPRENDHFRQVVEALPAAIYITDAEGVITYYNEAAA